MKSLPICLVLAAATAVIPAAASAADTLTFRLDQELSADDRTILEAFIGHAVDYAGKVDPEKVLETCRNNPETFCWVDFRFLDCLNTAYALTGDTAYLDQFRDAFAAYVDILETGTDKYLGWYGKTLKPRQDPDDPDKYIDELQTTFRAIGIMSRWVANAREDSAYAEANAATIKRYTELMTEHFFPKWDSRGHYKEIPDRGGVYHGLDYPSDHTVSLSFEKLSIIVDGLLALHAVTGDDQYLRRAVAVGAWYRSNLIPVGDHYEWMSWVPAGPWDTHPSKPDAWRIGWIAPDPNGSWYAASVSIAMNLYQHGILFGDNDLEAFLVTQKEQCWNGDLDDPVYSPVNGKRSKWTKGSFLAFPLAHYDPELQRLAFERHHFEQVLAKTGSAWHGGANANTFVRERYLMAPKVAQSPKPFAAVGKAFLEDVDNAAFVAGFMVCKTPCGEPPPATPSAGGANSSRTTNAKSGPGTRF